MFSRVAKYLREVRGELRKVVWPDRRETTVFTSVVILSVAFVALLIWVTDFILGGILSYVMQI